MLGFITDKQAKQLGYTHEAKFCGIKCFFKLRKLNEVGGVLIRSKNPILNPVLYFFIFLNGSSVMLLSCFGKDWRGLYLDVVRPL